jgi:hypothetical protein
MPMLLFFLSGLSGCVYPIGPDYFKQVKRVVSSYPAIFLLDPITYLAKRVVFVYRLIV